MNALPDSITVIGMGLMGGSLVRALERLPHAPQLTIVDSDETALAAAAQAGLPHRAATSLAAAPASDLLVLATPVAAIIDTLRRGGLEQYSFITDLGSVKAAPQQAAGAGGIADRYAGSHPLCGDHRGGFRAARADLYHDCVVYVASDGAAAARELVSNVWQALGARVVALSAAAHDTLVARTSHLPQVIASVLAATLAESALRAHDLGPGGRDTTRIAASDPRLWVDILLHNRAALLTALRTFDAQLHTLQHALESADAAALLQVLTAGSVWRNETS